MFERDGVLATWAVDTLPGPTLIEARQLPDHRLEYLQYEGPIHGDRGTVHRVDEGTYFPVTWTSDRVVVFLEGKQWQGTAIFQRVDSSSPEDTSSSDDASLWRLSFSQSKNESTRRVRP
ncbi:MAG TPA: hypothetical protein ENJ50_03235, partial [Planctomycetaceae bacterium]|nr:hypothetical protein [Planctomycetaceae bacterium]